MLHIQLGHKDPQSPHLGYPIVSSQFHFKHILLYITQKNNITNAAKPEGVMSYVMSS